MLIRHSVMYFFARGFPGLINLAALMIYTRMLTPQSFGQYALVNTGIVMGYAILYQWLHLGILRFYSVYETKERDFLVTVFLTYLGLSTIIAVVVIPSIRFVEQAENQQFLAIGYILLCFHAFHELNLHVTVVKGKPKEYAFYGLLRSLAGLVGGIALIWYGLGALGAILGTSAGLILTCVIGFYREWFFPVLKYFNKTIFIELFRYGLPLTVSNALVYIVSSSDRFILGWLIGIEATGKYAAGYDIASYILITIMVIINTAAYPLAVRALEQEGIVQAKKQLSANFTLLWAIALPCAVGIALLASPVAVILVGAEFREDAILLIPWVSIAVLLNGVRAFYIDISFQFGKRTLMQVWGVLAAAILNVMLNMLWIPVHGILGAAYASVAAFSAALIISGLLGRRIFSLPFPLRDFVKVVIATMLMAVMVFIMPRKNELSDLVWSIFLGAGVYFLMTYFLNIAGSKKYVNGLLRR